MTLSKSLPTISIIIPLYNKEKTIKHTISSVLSQSLTDFELIIVNDGSTDDSMEIVRTIHDNRIIIVEQENGGPGKARNTGVNVSRGEWILFLDADDELLSEALQTFSELIKEHPDADIIDCGQKLKRGKTYILMSHTLDGFSVNPMRDWYFHKIGPGSNHSLFSKKIVQRYPYNPLLRRFEDAELLTRMLKTAKVYSSLLPVTLVNCDYSSASNKRKDISEDYAGHLSLKGQDFWSKMCIYKIYIENRNLYPKEMRRLYPIWYYRYDLFLVYKLLNCYVK